MKKCFCIVIVLSAPVLCVINAIAMILPPAANETVLLDLNFATETGPGEVEGLLTPASAASNPGGIIPFNGYTIENEAWKATGLSNSPSVWRLALYTDHNKVQFVYGQRKAYRIEFDYTITTDGVDAAYIGLQCRARNAANTGWDYTVTEPFPNSSTYVASALGGAGIATIHSGHCSNEFYFWGLDCPTDRLYTLVMFTRNAATAVIDNFKITEIDYQDTPSPLEIVILGTTATLTSSPYSLEPSNAFDGNLDTPWQPLPDPKGMWLRLDFAKPVTFNAARIYENIDYDKNRYNVTKVQLLYSDDGAQWNSAYSGETIGERLNMDFATITAKHVRLDIMGTESPMIGEIKLLYKTQETPGDAVTYYVSTSGDDENEGTEANPFRTIQHAADIMKAGDACLVRGGTYRESVVPENSGEMGKPITFAAYPGEKVTVSGADPLEGSWDVHNGQIYRMSYDQKVTQLFVNGEMYNIARWPNAKVNNLHEPMWARATWGMTKPADISNPQDPYQYAWAGDADYGFVQCPELPDGDWDGAILHIWPGHAWNARFGEVTQTIPKRLDFVVPFKPGSNGLDPGDPWRPQSGNKFFVYGVLAALDIPTEWVQDRVDNSIYLWTESGDPAGQLIERKSRNWAFDVVGKSYITIEGFNIFASSVRVRASDNCLVNRCNILYPGDNIHKPVMISGSDNAITNSLIAHSPGDGVLLYGNNNLVGNCIIHDINTYGDHHAAVQTKGVGNRILHNTMYKAGRSLILHYSSRKMRIEHNILRDGGTLAMDLGATYSYGDNNGDGSQGSVIAYNWVINLGTNTGIYLDSFSKDYLIYRNVVDSCYTALVVNGGGLNNMIYNNTFLNETTSFFSTTFPGMDLTQKGSRVINNIWKGNISMWEAAIKDPGDLAEFTNNMPSQVDSYYVPLKGSAAVDRGLELPGFTDGFVGSAPDIGAYEFGGVYWEPGTNWKTSDDDQPLAEVEKFDPSVPTGLFANYGQILSDVTLPPGWSWMNEMMPVGDVGEQTHKAKYTPIDVEIYKMMTNIDLNVTVVPITSSGEDLLEDPLRAWIQNKLLHVTGLIPGKTLSVYTITGALVYHSVVSSYEADIKLKVPGVYIVHSGGRSVKVAFE